MRDVHDPGAGLDAQDDTLHGGREVIREAEIRGQRDHGLAHALLQ